MIEDFIEEGENSGVFVSPIYNVQKIPVEKLRANTYNPNKQDKEKFKLLYESILNDGYTQPIVAMYVQEEDMYEIVDGFHRYSVALKYEDIYKREHGYLPVVVIDKPEAERMASTIRHNRARGEHSVELMQNIVSNLIDSGLGDNWIKKHLGMDADELLRLKQLTGLQQLFVEDDFSKSWIPYTDK